MTRMSLRVAFSIGSAALLLAGCSNSTEPDHKVDIPANGAQYVVFAWNDLGMHCLNPTYDQAVILPPYNTVWAQVVKRGNPPEIVTDGLEVGYQLVDNTFSSGKTDSHGGDFAQFWQYCEALFGVTLDVDTGLNLEDPAVHNGLSGQMALKGDHFQVNGIPVVPVSDAGVWGPYQVMELAVTSGGTRIAYTQATVPTSDEINCAKCHAQGGVGTVHIAGGGGPDVFANILSVHDALSETTLEASAPVLCASCHGSPALGTEGPGSAGAYLSDSVHSFHSITGAACLDCHPGQVTECNRSLAHTAADGNCTTCHGTLAEVASSIEEGRVPWADEPKCATCHTGIPQVDTGTTLYRNAVGHGGMYCTACHGSPHAMFPSREVKDNYQPLQYQSSSKSIGSCGVCHGSSRGEGASEFGETHGGTGGRPTACRVCHTVVPTNTAAWPHEFKWKAR
jgi:hypothetical protein